VTPSNDVVGYQQTIRRITLSSLSRWRHQGPPKHYMATEPTIPQRNSHSVNFTNAPFRYGSCFLRKTAMTRRLMKCMKRMFFVVRLWHHGTFSLPSATISLYIKYGKPKWS